MRALDKGDELGLRNGCGSRGVAPSARMPRAARGGRPGIGELRLEGRRAQLAVLVTFCALVGGMLLWSSPALAISQRGHAFSFSFGAGGKGEGQLLGPSGIAVDASNGSVYVADTFNNRVEKFEPQVNGEGELVGEKFAGAFPVPFPEAIAVDNSASESKGDIY